MGVLMAPIAALVTGFNVIIFSALYAIFFGAGISGTFPFPDQIVFNKIAFFDPNFINPQTVNTATPVAILQSTISNMYYTFYLIAISIFIVAAIFIGIKLAMSSIASEKSHYKQVLNSWIIGIVLLFTVHFLMAGIFAINEKFVEIAYSLIDEDALEFKVNLASLIPMYGNAIAGLLKNVSKIFGASSALGDVTVYGYGGMVLMFFMNGLGGDIVSALVFAIILGQTIAFSVLYLKRVFYCIILGMIAPLIVAMDVIKKAAG